MILIPSDRRNTPLSRVLPKIERLNVPVTWWDNGEFRAGSRVTDALAGGSGRATPGDPAVMPTVTARAAA